MYKQLVSIFIGLLFFSLNLLAAESINVGKRYEIESEVLSEKRKISVYLPQGYDENTEQTYPVLYLLDGDDTNFLGMSGTVQILNSPNLSRQIPKMIVVAIPNTNRSRDLTPTKTDLIFKGKTLDEIPQSGGADTFLNFIESELIPFIETKHRVTERRILVGMSFGGLFTANALLTKPHIFTDYHINDATFVWDNNYLNRLLEENIATVKLMKKNVFIGYANNDHLGEIGVANSAWAKDFITRLSNQAPKIKLSSKHFPEHQHGTVMFISWYYGLKALFHVEQ